MENESELLSLYIGIALLLLEVNLFMMKLRSYCKYYQTRGVTLYCEDIEELLHLSQNTLLIE